MNRAQRRVFEYCWCPCNCGCPTKDLNDDGLCQDCVEGNHEVPPDGVCPSLEDLLKMHESCVVHFKQVLKDNEPKKD